MHGVVRGKCCESFGGEFFIKISLKCTKHNPLTYSQISHILRISLFTVSEEVSQEEEKMGGGGSEEEKMEGNK